jgi:endonuclease YncB( thermonuclease family)
MLRLRRLTGLLIALAGLKALAAIQEAGKRSRSQASRPTSGRAIPSSSSVGPEPRHGVTPLDCDRAAQSSRPYADQESSVLRTETASGVARHVCSVSAGPQKSDRGKSRPRLMRFGYFMFGGLWLVLGGFFVLTSIGNVGKPPLADKVETAAPIEVQHPAAATNIETPKLPLGERSEPPSQTLTGVPEVVDTSTLLLSGKIVHLFGVHSTEGAKPADLERYLAGRAVACTSIDGADAFRCEVEGRDISQVVLFNGGGRASADATPQLREAEDRARAQRIGVWSER